jgi:predicted enzyme related to lactoylglutathione lyase
MHQSLPDTIDYVEMPSRDLAGTKRFFTGLFGWSFQDYGPEYAAFDDGRTTGGFFASGKTAGVDQGGVLIVFYHRDLAAISAAVEKLGGEITRPIFDFPGGRRFHFREPGGGEFAVWSEK